MTLAEAPLGGITYARFFPSDWRSGCLNLSLEEEGLYIRSCAWMYDTGQCLPDNDSVAARILHVQVQKYSKVMAALIEKGKMIRAQGMIMNRRVFDDIDKFRQQQAARSAAAVRRENERRDALARAATEAILSDRGAKKKASTPPRGPTGPPHQPPPLTPPRLPGGYPPTTPGGSPEGASGKDNKINGTEARLWQTSTTALADAGKARSHKEEVSEEKKQQQPSEQDAEGLLCGGSERAEPLSLNDLYNRLLEAAGTAVGDPAKYPGLMHVGDVLGWLNAGADLDLDILPTLKVASARHRLSPKAPAKSWGYFAHPVAESVERRKRGLPAVTVELERVTETQAERFRRLAMEMDSKGGRR